MPENADSIPAGKPVSIAAQLHVAKLKTWHAILFFVAICLSLIGVVTWAIWNSYQYQVHDKEVAMANLAQTLSWQVQATVKQADTVLLGLVERLQIDGIDSAILRREQYLLSAQGAELPQIQGVFVYDEQGRWLINTAGGTPPNANNSDREYFIFHRDHPDLGPYIGPSIRSRTTGDWVLTISRRINHADGRFAGVVLATIQLQHFLRLYEKIDVGSNGVITLISENAAILVRHPFKEADIGKSLINAPLFTQLLPKAPFGTATVKSAVDGVERVVGYRRVEEYPLITFAAVERYEILSSWRKETLLSAAITLLLLVILGGIGYQLIRLMKQQVQAQTELREAKDKLLEANRILEFQALQDGLTGLANRRQFDSFIYSELGRAKRNQELIAILMLDVDYFKKFNDQYGHLAGDECLKNVGTIIKESIRRPGDIAARYGGEEFAVVLPGTDSLGAFVVAEKIRRAVQEMQIENSNSQEGSVTVSIGVSAIRPSDNDSPESLIGAADKALYKAKTSGKNMSVISGCLNTDLIPSN